MIVLYDDEKIELELEKKRRYRQRVDLNSIEGKRIVAIEEAKEYITFFTECGMVFSIYHEEECCETVYLADVCGHIPDLIDQKISIEEVSSDIDQVNELDTGERRAEEQWTFYKINSLKCSVTLRFYGKSNGYYGMRVEFYQLWPPRG